MIDINSISWNSSPADINEAIKLISQRGEHISDYPTLQKIIKYVFEEQGINNTENPDEVGKLLSTLAVSTVKEILLLKQIEKLSQEFQSEKNIYRLIEIADELIKIRNGGHKLNLDYRIEGFIDKLEAERKEISKKDELTDREKEIELIIELESEIKEVEDEPENRLNYLKIKELVEAYEKATSDKERDQIIDQIANTEQVERGNVARMMKRQLEIARELKNLEILNFEILNEKKEILLIAKNEKISTKEAKAVLDEAKTVNAKIRVDNFVEETANKTGNYKDIIKIEVKKAISGDSGKMEIPDDMDPVLAKLIELETEKFIKKNPKTIRQNQLSEINEEIDVFKIEINTKEDARELEKVREILIKFHNVSNPDVRTSKSRNDAQIKLEKDNGISVGRSNGLINKIQVVLDSAYQSPQEFNNLVSKTNKLSVFGKRVLAGTKLGVGIEELSAKIASNPATAKIFLAMQRMSKAKIDLINLGMKIPGVNKLLVGTSDLIGGAAMVTFLQGSNIIVAEQGMIPGAISIFKLIVTGAGALEGAAGVEGITTASATLAAWSGVPVLGQIIIVVALVITMIYGAYKIYDKLADWIKGITKINFLWGVRDFFTNIFGNNWFGKSVGTVAQLGFNGLMFGGALIVNFLAVLSGPILAAGLGAMTAIVTPVIVSFVVGTLAYNMLFTMPKIASLVPPPPEGAGGSCQPKEDAGTPAPSSGEINCNQNAPEANIGISKEDFGKFADDWNANIGKNYARECFNDVVNKAKCAGIVPEYALWTWLHESGASNYERFKDTSDFGVVYKKHNNFDDQITEFLKLDPATACINDPKIASDPNKYWLAFSTNFLTGECDPDKIVDGVTGREYLVDLMDSWSRLGSPPANIHSGTPGGQNCGGNTTGVVAEGENEFVAADGTVMVCSGPVDSEGNFVGIPGESAYDPNAPGLVGEIVLGECSVASQVVSTKQCGQSWSNKTLPGGGGTICSAGCGPSSTSSILRSINGSLTPDTVIFESGSPFGNMTGDGSSLGQVKQSLAKHGIANSGGVGACSQKDIANWICQGKAVVILSDSYTGGGGGTIGHILVVVAVQGGKLITKDPYYSNSTPFVTEGGIKAGQVKTLRECLPVQLKKD
ncbi:MAG: hypothetical protein WC069_05480 [Candidatus Shapirobacteria bacterium]